MSQNLDLNSILKLQKGEMVQQQGVLMKRGGSNYEENKGEDVVVKRNIDTLLSTIGKIEKKRYVVLTTIAGDINKQKEPFAYIHSFIRNVGRDLFHHKIDLTADSEVQYDNKQTIKIIVPGRTYWFRAPVGSTTAAKAEMTAAQWYNNIDAAIQSLWDYNYRRSTAESRATVQVGLKQVEFFKLPENISEVMADKRLHKQFVQFIEFAHASENILFLENVEEFEELLNETKNMKMLITHADKIRRKFVNEDSKQEVNLSAPQRGQIIELLSKPKDKIKYKEISNVFSEAKQEIVLLLEKNFFRKFLVELQRKTNAFCALYEQHGLLGYRAVLGHFGPVKTDVERLINQIDGKLQQKQKQLKILTDAIRLSHDVAVDESPLLRDALQELYNQTDFRATVLSNYVNELTEQVLDPLRYILSSIKVVLDKLAEENKDCICDIERHHEELQRAKEVVNELVNLKTFGDSYDAKRASKMSAAKAPAEKRKTKVSFVGKILGRNKAKQGEEPSPSATSSPNGSAVYQTGKRRSDEYSRLGCTPETIDEAIALAEQAVQTAKNHVEQSENENAAQLIASLDKLESLELHRINLIKKVLQHSVVAEKDLNESFAIDNHRSLELANRVVVNKDIASYATSLKVKYLEF